MAELYQGKYSGQEIDEGVELALKTLMNGNIISYKVQDIVNISCTLNATGRQPLNMCFIGKSDEYNDYGYHEKQFTTSTSYNINVPKGTFIFIYNPLMMADAVYGSFTLDGNFNSYF